MSVTIRMRRLGRNNTDVYRIAAVDSRNPRDGKVLEDLGHYDPTKRDAAQQVLLNAERVKYWLSVGARPSDTVRQIIRKQGIAVS